MHLKSLEIHGFKSFADKTKLEFHEGVTGIVGPNGCGKSNIVDAMRWVLGETSAKALRGGEMADVIFNGTDKRSALGMAEVTLTLAGCTGILETEYDEVSIGRRVYRDGKSEYLLNKQPCRLKDIHNLLMDTGIGRTSYSIMEQGKIDMLLSSKPEDRRAVFEEAAGITKYKAQKKEALRKLDYTEANLIRIRDVIAENERQIRSLSRQASKAKRYQTLADDVRILELHLSHKKWRELRAEKSELSGSIHQFTLRQDTLEDAIETRQAEMAGARVEHQEIERRLGELRSQLSRLEHEIASSRDRINFHAERAHELSALITKNEGDIADASEKHAQQEVDIENANRQLEAVAARITEQESRTVELEQMARDARKRREEHSHLIREQEDKKRTLVGNIARLEATLAANEKQCATDKQRAKGLEEELTRLRADEDTCKTESDDYRDSIAANQIVVEEFEENLVALDQKCHLAKRAATDLQDSLASLHKLLTAKQSRLEVLQRLIAEGEGLEKGTQEVLRGLGDPDRFSSHIRSPLASRMSVDSRFVDAIEAALGRQLQVVVVEDLHIAETIMSTLRDGNLGMASVIAETHIGTGDIHHENRVPLGAISWAIDKVQCDAAIHSLVARLLSGILLVEDLPTALRLREESGPYPIATLSGEFISAEGIIHGGRSADESFSILKLRTEVSELARIVEALEGEIATRQGRREELSLRVSQFEDLLVEARERLQQKRLVLSGLEGKLTLVARDLGQLQNRIDSLDWERKEVVERTEKLLTEIRTKQEDREATLQQISDLDASLVSTNELLIEARQTEEALTEQLTAARTQYAVEKGTREKFEEQRSPMLARLKELTELLTRRTGEIQQFRSRIDSDAVETELLQKKIADNSTTIQTLSEEKETLTQDREIYVNQIEEGETDLSQMRKEVQSIISKKGKEEVKAAQFSLALENLERQCRERYRTELEFFEPDSHALLLAIEARRKNGATRLPVDSGGSFSPSLDDEETPGLPLDVESVDSDSSDAEFNDPAEPDWGFVEGVVDQLRTKLDAMGPINIDAIEEFDELEEHYRFNMSQLEDLEKSKEELLRMMARINRDTRRMFAETFEQVRKNFREMFKELFGEKAKADLILLDDSDPLECGIDIIAKPPGKKLQSISLLSGGERSMTAVALLFGIYMVKPSPFCVLDELDAPLDEANIVRFLRVLDRFIGDSQFVIVTHSKRTMSRADIMYGVSMEEFGVSKTVGVTFSKAGESKGGKQATMIGG